MPPKSLRVHQLAKELNVNSKVIVAKCEAEGVPGITNHMSVVKLGLAATVREWFGDESEASAEHHAVETAEKVDIKKVRKPRKKAAKANSAGGSADDANVATLDAPAESGESAEPATAEDVKKPARKPKPKVVEAAEPDSADGKDAAPPAARESTVRADAEKLADSGAPEAPDKVETPAAAEQTPAAPEVVSPAGVQNVPTRPDVVLPAGEQLDVPTKVKLAGPKVIRVEKPEPDRPPRPRRSGPGGGPTGGPRGGGGGGGGGGDVPGISRSRGPARGGGVRGGGGGAEAGATTATSAGAA